MKTIEQLEKENAALAAQVEALRNGIVKAREELSCCNVNSAGERLAHLLETTPQHHLRELKAQAVKDFIEFMYMSKDCQLCSKSLDKANQYADQIRREVE